MDFVTALLKMRNNNDTIWVIVDRLTKSTVFVPIKETWKKKQLAKTYFKHVVRFHGFPTYIISDRDSRFLSKFWQEVQLNLGTTLKMSSAFHPKINGQIERTNQTMEDMLRGCVIDFHGSCEDHLDLIDFSYNKSYHASIKMAPFEALYARRCKSPVCWNDFSENIVLGTEFIKETVKNVKLIQARIQAVKDRQKSYAD